MTENTTDPKPTRQDLLDAWAAYEAAWTAAEAGGWEYDLSMAAANAYAPLLQVVVYSVNPHAIIFYIF